MKNVEVLLRERVQDLGQCGDVVRVAPGYARNYLLPKRLAISATEENKKMMQRRRGRIEIEEAARSAEVRARVEALNGLQLATQAKADESGQLYGSVNAAQVAGLIQARGFKVAEKDVRLAQGPIRRVGEHAIVIHVQDEQYAEIVLLVSAESAS